METLWMRRACGGGVRNLRMGKVPGNGTRLGALERAPLWGGVGDIGGERRADKNGKNVY